MMLDAGDTVRVWVGHSPQDLLVREQRVDIGLLVEGVDGADLVVNNPYIETIDACGLSAHFIVRNNRLEKVSFFGDDCNLSVGVCSGMKISVSDIFSFQKLHGFIDCSSVRTQRTSLNAIYDTYNLTDNIGNTNDKNVRDGIKKALSGEEDTVSVKVSGTIYFFRFSPSFIHKDRVFCLVSKGTNLSTFSGLGTDAKTVA